MILCAVIGIAIVSYLSLGRTGMGISNRALYSNGAMNLAENGLEYSMHAVNKSVADTAFNWGSNGWKTDGSNAFKKWSDNSLGKGVSGEVRAVVQGFNGAAAPVIVARSTVTLGSDTANPIEKWIEVQLRKTSKFANGLVAKETISFSGNNASVDSWNSDPDNDPSTPMVPYSDAVKKDNGSVGSVSVAVSAVLVNNADIYGYAATGGAPPSVGANGLIGPFGTASGTVDQTRVSSDFSASFDPVDAPAGSYTLYVDGGSSVINSTVSLPRAGVDTLAADGYYYIEANSINYNNKVVTITDKVILKLTNATTAINIGGGSGALNINPGAELQIYAEGDIKIAGNGVMNGGTTAATANQPAAAQFYGTKTSGTQDIQIAGNGALSAVVYAPQGSVKINGNGDVLGSVVANDITLVGNAAFHYDEALANFGGNNPYRVARWKELTTVAERDAYAAMLGGW